jgi:hypothetical protein
MASNQKLVAAPILFTFVLTLFSTPVCSVYAQAESSSETGLLAANNVDSDAAPITEANDEAIAADPSAQATGATTSEPSSKDDKWHVSVSPYLWFPGVYGTIGFPNRNLKLQASAGEVLSHFDFGLMGRVEVRRKWLVLPLDLLWVRLEDDKPVPLQEKIKVDFLTGFRYWHISNSLTFKPSALGLSFSNTLNWVDQLVGGHIQTALSPKIVVNLFGDVGGWGTGSLIEYQLAGLIGYKIKPAVTLHAGYRYLRVAYRSGLFLLNLDDPGVIFGVTISLK